MKKIAICSLLFFSTLCLFSYAHGGDPKPPRGKQQLAGPLAPEFTLRDISGKTRSLKDYRGKVVLLYFTTTWCPYCKRDIPNLKKTYQSMKGRDFELLAIYINESPKKVASFAAQHDLPYPVLLDSDASIAITYGIRGVPAKILLRKDGSIACGPCIAVEERLDELMRGK